MIQEREAEQKRLNDEQARAYELKLDQVISFLNENQQMIEIVRLTLAFRNKIMFAQIVVDRTADDYTTNLQILVI